MVDKLIRKALKNILADMKKDKKNDPYTRGIIKGLSSAVEITEYIMRTHGKKLD